MLFSRLELAHAALARDDVPKLRATILPPVSIDETYVFDITEVMDILLHKDHDETSLLVDFLNILLDLTAATGARLPSSYRRVLFGLANHMTFSTDVASYWADSGVSAERAVNAIYWCFGAIITHSVILE